MLRSLTGFRRYAFEKGFIGYKYFYSTNLEYEHKGEPYDIFRNRFLKAFNDENIDGWQCRVWLQKLYLEDCIPPTEVVSSALMACRRLNDIALAIRFMETIKIKCKQKRGAWESLNNDLAPILKEIGLPTLHDLGYDKPELALKDYDDDNY